MNKAIIATGILALQIFLLSFFCACTKTHIEEVHVFDTTVVIVRDTILGGSISGVVRRESNRNDSHLPISPYRGAKVSITNQGGGLLTDTTDATGYFSISNLPEGRYRVDISGKQENSLTFDVNVAKKSNSVVKTDLFDCVFLPDNKVERKPWTFVHYGCLADKSMQMNQALFWEFRMLEREIVSTDRVNHVVYIPATASQSIRSQILYLQKPPYKIENEKPFGDSFEDPVLLSESYRFDAYDFADADPADYNVLMNSTSQIATLFPSDSVVLCLYDHGTGIDIAFSEDDGVVTRSICGNAETRKEITVPELRKTLMTLKEQGIKVHSVVMSACLMGVFELAYELKDCGLKYIIASERQSSNGFYLRCNEWLEQFNSGNMSLTNALTSIVNTQSANNNYALYDMSRFNELNTLFGDFAHKISLTDPSYIKPIVVKTIKSGAGSSGDLEYSCYDLGDFAKNVSEASFEDKQNLRASAALLYQFLKDKKPGNFITTFNNKHSNADIEARGTGIGVLLRAPDCPYKGHNQNVYRRHKYYLDGNHDWDKFLSNLDQ